MLTDRTDGRTNGRTEIWTPISHPAISRCDKNRILKFWIMVEEELYYPSSENKGAEQVCSYCICECGCKVRFVSDLVRNPDCWFSCVKAQF